MAMSFVSLVYIICDNKCGLTKRLRSWDALDYSHRYLGLLFTLLSKSFKKLNNDASIGTIKDIDGGAAHPCLQVV